MEYNFTGYEQELEDLVESSDLEFLWGKSICVVGATGLIGSYFTNLFLFLNDNYGFQIKLDLISSSLVGLSPVINRVNDWFNFRWDLRREWNTKLESDYVIFAAGYGQPKKFVSDPSGTILVNTVGLSSLLDCVTNPDMKLLYCSSAEVYGNPNEVPTPETYKGVFDVDNPRSCYIEAKRTGEIIALQYNSVIARIALCYGVGMRYDDTRAMIEFIRKAKQNGSIQLLGGADSLRTYIYIYDCVRILLSLLRDSNKHRIYNVGGIDETVSISELACIISENVLGNRDGVVLSASVNNQGVAPDKVQLSMKRFLEEYPNFKQHLSLNGGIKNLCNWFNQCV